MSARRLLLSVALGACVLAGLAVPASAGADVTFRGARRYALVVAGWYGDGTPHGDWYWNVTRSFYSVLRERYGLFDDDIEYLVHKDKRGDPLVDGFSTVAEISAAIGRIAAAARPEDTVVFYFVGHGGSDHFAASDTALHCAQLSGLGAAVRSEHQLWTFSQCQSGRFPVVCARAGRAIFSSTRLDEDNAMPWAEAVRDAFDYAPGADADGDGLVSFGEAHNYARQAQVKHYGGEARLKEHSQFCDCGCAHPTTGALPQGNHGSVALRETLGAAVGQVQLGTLTAGDGQQVTFPRPFAGKPTVLCAAEAGGQPLAACAVDNTPRGFVLGLQSPGGARVTAAKASWVAFLPGGSPRLQGGCQWIDRSRETIRFGKRFARLPLVVCNAQRQGGALVAGANSFDTEGFQVRVSDLQGRPVEGSWLLWIAAEPGLQSTSLNVEGGYLANYPHGGARGAFDPVSWGAEVLVGSAAWDDGGRRVLVERATRDNLNLKVMLADGQYAAPAWHAHYLSFRVSPPLAPVRLPAGGLQVPRRHP